MVLVREVYDLVSVKTGNLEVKLTYGHIWLLQDLLKGFVRICYRKQSESLATGREAIDPLSELAVYHTQPDFIGRCHFHTGLMKTKYSYHHLSCLFFIFFFQLKTGERRILHECRLLFISSVPSSPSCVYYCVSCMS